MTSAQPPTNISVSQDFELTLPSKGRGFMVPTTEWDYVRQKVEGIEPPTLFFQTAGSFALGVAGSALVSAIAVPPSTSLLGVPSDFVCWALVVVFGVCGASCLGLANKDRRLTASTKIDALGEMDRLKERYCGPSPVGA